MKTEEIMALREITSNVTKMAEISKLREEDVDTAIESFDTKAGSLKTFKEKWKELTITVLNGILKACDLSQSKIVNECYWNLIRQMNKNPENKIVEDLYFAFTETMMHEITQSNEEYAKIQMKREDVTYDLMRKEMYLKAELNYKEFHEGGSE